MRYDRHVTRLMIQLYNLEKLNMDFMGYERNSESIYTYHHLIIPKCLDGEKSIENGAILYRMSHDYLHLVEHLDEDAFFAITSELIDINLKMYLDYRNVKRIDEILKSFEREHCSDTNRNGQILIKEEFTRRRILK